MVSPVVRGGLPGAGDGGGGGVRAVAHQALTGVSGDFVRGTLPAVSAVGRDVCLHHGWEPRREKIYFSSLSEKETEIQEKMFVINRVISTSLLRVTQLYQEQSARKCHKLKSYLSGTSICQLKVMVISRDSD